MNQMQKAVIPLLAKEFFPRMTPNCGANCVAEILLQRGWQIID